MLKLKENAIKTLAKSLAGINDKKGIKNTPLETNRLNQILRAAFGVLEVQKNTHTPEIIKKTPLEKNTPLAAATAPKAIEIRQNADASNEKKIADGNILQSIKEQRKEAEKEAAETAKKRAQEEQRRIEQQEREKATKAAEEEKKRAQERQAAQEKIRLEKEEKRRQLTLLEAERTKKIIQDMERQKQAAAIPENTIHAEKETENLQTALHNLAAKLFARKEYLEKELSIIPATKAPLEQKRLALESKISMIKNSELAAVEEREREIEKKAANEKNLLGQTSDPIQEKTIEQKIWETEDQRKNIEKQRWAVEDRINGIVKEAKNIDDEVARKKNEAEFIKQNIQDICGKEKLVKFAADKNKLEEEILKIIDEKKGLSPAMDDAINKKNSAEMNLAEISQKETSGNANLNAIEEREKQTTDPAKKREIEQSRWQANSNLKSIIQSKWEAAEKLRMAMTNLQSLQGKINALNAKADKIQNNIAAGEIALEKENLPVHKIRDAICDLFKENNLEINQDILKDITQTQDTQKPEPAHSAKEPAADANRQSAPSRPAAVQGFLQEKTPTNNDASTVGAKEVETPATTPAPAIIAKKIDPPENANPVESNISNTNTAQKSIGKYLPENDARQKSEANIIANPAATALKNKTPEQSTPKPSPETSAFYREQVDAAPATRIRAFPRKILPENDTKISDQAQPTTANPDKKPQNAAPANEQPVQNENKNEPLQNLGNRWNQIKKANTPAPNPEAITANAPQPAIPFEIEPKAKNKFLIRMLVIFILAGILGIAMVMILSKNSDAPVVKKTANIPAKTATTTSTEGEKQTPPENENKNNPQPSTLAVISTISIYTEDLASVPNLILPYLRKSLGNAGYYKISLQNKKTNSDIGLKQFLNIFKVNAPTLFYSSVSDDFTLFIYSNNGKNRIGFVTAVTNAESLETAMEGWKGSIAQDTDNLFKLIGRKTQPETSTLKFNSANGGSAQYQTMNFVPAEDNFSIAWAIYQQKHFVFSTSNESISKIFDQLPK